MTKDFYLFKLKGYYLFFLSSFFLTLGLVSPAVAQLYNPIALPKGNEISDSLSDRDIPTGEGGFARDYYLELKQGDQVAIDLISDEFDAMVILLAADGATVAENDDGPDSSNNSLLFARITEDGRYIIRVTAFGATGGGNFKLKVSRLRPVS
jgi:hypothetical protein